MPFFSLISGRKMKYRKLFDPGPGGQQAGLCGGEMIFFSSDILVGVQKGGLDKKVIRSVYQRNNPLGVGLIVRHVGDVAYFLTRCDKGNVSGQLS
jgi:hypothetical protein